MKSSIRSLIGFLVAVISCGPTYATSSADKLIWLNAEKIISVALPSSDDNIDATLPPLPIVLFIPGILGSQIEECDPGPLNCKIIWGELSAGDLIWDNQDLSIKKDKLYQTSPLFEFEAPINGKEDIYGRGFSQIKESYVGRDDIALGFSYDWRQDNAISAKKLHEYICTISQDKIRNRPVIFVAHSMGGLVLKYWYLELYKNRTPCPSGNSLDLDISRIMFLGTPHYGAPKAIAAFANGYDLDVHPQGIFGTLKGHLVNGALANALDRAGVHFQSGYELLPVYGEGCQPPLPTMEMASPVVTSTGGKIELFQEHSWEQLGWPKAITDRSARELFYRNELQPLLDKAKAFLCRTAQFVADPATKVTYYYASDFPTDESYRLGRMQSPGNSDQAIPVVADAGPNDGDGTVPENIGMDLAEISMNRQNVDSRFLDLSHQDMLNARLFQKDLQTIFRLAIVRRDEILLKKASFRKVLFDRAVNLSRFAYLPPPLPDAADTLFPVAAFPEVASFNRDLMEARHQQISDLAVLVTDPHDNLLLDQLAALASSVEPPVPNSRDSGSKEIRVGILHSLTGMMAASEAPLKDVLSMLIDEQNRRGGLLGKRLVPVIADTESSWPASAEKALELLSRDKVAVIFGCWTSVCRKSVLPVVEEQNGILFYPVQFEGGESSKNIFYTGSTPNQQALPAVDFLMRQKHFQRWVLEGTDYVYSRTVNRILQAYLKSKGVKDEDISVNYTPFGFSDWEARVSAIKKFASQGKNTAIISTIDGDANIPFYAELGSQDVRASDVPVMALSLNEADLAGIDTKPLIGHLAATNYFESNKAPINTAFVAQWKEFTKNDRAVTNDPIEATYLGFNLWVKAVQIAGTTDPGAVRNAILDVSVPNLSGGTVTMLPNHHLAKPVFIGEIKDSGQFDIVSRVRGSVAGEAWSDFLNDSRDLIADWREPLSCGNFNVKTGKCDAPAYAAGPEIVAGPAADSGCFVPWTDKTKFFKYPAKPGPYRIALANGYITNTWRIQMIQTAKAYAAQPEVAAKLKEFKVVSTGEDVAAQIAAVNNFIDSGFDAIVVNAQNPAAFRPVIKRANDAGVVLVAFDNILDTEGAINVDVDQKGLGVYWAQWLDKHLPSGGKILEVRGVSGTSVDRDRHDGIHETLNKTGKKWDIIEVYGKWDDPTAQKVTADAIAVQKHFDGIIAQGGDIGVVRAMLDAKHAMVPFGGETENGFRKFCAKMSGDGLMCASGGAGPAQVAVAIKVAISALEGQVVPQSVKLPLATAEDPNFKDGENYYPDASDNFFVGNSFPTCNINFDAAEVMGQSKENK